MRKYYSCDGGCITIGNETARVHIPNGYGDGTFRVQVMRKTTKVPEGYNWEACVEGDKLFVYDYDCLKDWSDKKRILYTLNGQYGVYINRGDIILQKW